MLLSNEAFGADAIPMLVDYLRRVAADCFKEEGEGGLPAAYSMITPRRSSGEEEAIPQLIPADQAIRTVSEILALKVRN